MELDPKHKVFLTKAYARLISTAEASKNFVALGSIWDATEAIAEQATKNEDIKNLITRDEIAMWSHGHLYQLASQLTNEQQQPLSKLLSAEVIDSEGTNLIKLLEALPYKYTYYFQLPMQLPDGLNSIDITADISVIRKVADVLFIEKPISSLADALLGRSRRPYLDTDVFLKIQVQGYGNNARGKAISRLKQFLYLAEASGLFTFRSWDRKNTQSFITQHYLAHGLYDNQLQSFDMPAEVSTYISGLKLVESKFQDYLPPDPKIAATRTLITGHDNTYEDYFSRKFLSGCNRFIELLSEKRRSDRDHIYSAIEWGFDGAANFNETMGFIQACIGMEALLGDKTEGGQEGLTKKLADRCSYLLGNTPNKRRKEAERFTKIYRWRSKLVHGVSPKLAEDAAEIASDAAFLLKQLVYKELYLSSQ